MSKGKKIFAIIILICACLIMTLFILKEKNRVSFDKFSYGESKFCYEDSNQIHEIKKQDLDSLYTILNGKEMFYEELSCGFSENIAICIDGKYTFCFAQDGDSYVYLKEENKLIILASHNREDIEVLCDEVYEMEGGVISKVKDETN